MRSHQGIAIGGLIVAFAIVAFAAPASAASGGRITFVNGIPGKQIDVCVNGKEVRSKLGYGKKATRSFGSPGTKKLKVFLKHPGRCKGTRLAKKSFPLDPNGDLTIVLTKKGPKVVPFDNTGLGTVGPAADDIAVVWRHAADVGGVTFKSLLVPSPPITPVADPVWTKGDEGILKSPLAAPVTIVVEVTRPDVFVALVGPIARTVRPDRRYEFIFVGSRTKNARLVMIVTKVDSFIS